MHLNLYYFFMTFLLDLTLAFRPFFGIYILRESLKLLNDIVQKYIKNCIPTCYYQRVCGGRDR